MERLVQSLIRSSPSLAMSWEAGEEPPDFWLILDGERVAVEHSSIQRKDHNVASTAFQQLIEETNEEAVRAGEVRGLYIVDLCGAILNLGKLRAKIKNEIRKHVRESASLESHQREPIYVKGQPVMSIQKIKDTDSLITWGWSPDPEANWPPEVQAELIALLKERVIAKARIAGDLNCRTILLLEGVYSAATETLWVACLKQIPERAAFWRIFVIDSYGNEFWGYP